MTKRYSGGRVIFLSGLAVAVSAALLSAHDFWIVPTGFEIAPGNSMEVRGQTGVRFPVTVSAVTPERIAEARLLSASREERITDLQVGGKSLLIRHRPTAAGQRVVTVALVTRTSRAAPAGLKRYIALEGGPELAERYDREGAFAGSDSITQLTTKYAKTILEVGRGGPRAFARRAGHALEFMPLTDPAGLLEGDTLEVRLLFHGRPLAGAHLHAGAAPEAALDDSTALRPGSKELSLVTNRDGVAKVPLGEPGLWNVRTLHAAPATSGRAGEWEVAFATIVIRTAAGANGGSTTPARPDSAAAAATVARFHEALAAGDSTGALALLTPDVVILESGGMETREEYRSHHLPADIAFARAVPTQRGPVRVVVHGDVAWASSTSTTTGEYRGRQVNSNGAELMVLRREAEGWRIAAIHWSSRARRPPG